MRILPGVAASPGAAVAPAYVLRHGPLDLPELASGPPEGETARLAGALDGIARDLEAAGQRASGDASAILHAQATIARDPALRASAGAAIAAGAPAARAIVDAGRDFSARLAATGNPYLAARAADVTHICDLAARALLGLPARQPIRPESPCVLVADDLMPVDTADLDPALVVGIATAGGSPTSHTSILARALGIPAVVAVPHLLDQVRAGTIVGLDGDSGAVHLEPGRRDVERLHAVARSSEARRRQDRARAGTAPTATLDGVRVEVAANIGSLEELRVACDEGAEAVGLLRTELLFIDRDRPPTGDEQAELLLAMREVLGPRRIVVRTFDIGSDKPVPFLPARPERNPELGVRGIRLARRHPDLLAVQLEAVAKLAATGPTAVMAPMVAVVEEVDWFARQVRACGAPRQLELGVMVEVPSTVLMAAEIAERVDFVSVGTNDLSQYLHAADRRHPALAPFHQPFHPALLRAVAMVCQAAGATCWVGVCGEAASDPAWACLAVGLGVTELSMPAASIPAVRATLRRVSRSDCAAAAEQAGRLSDPAAIRAVAAELVASTREAGW
jgi:phosphoenolpyruvate-protein phosphotransferase